MRPFTLPVQTIDTRSSSLYVRIWLGLRLVSGSSTWQWADGSAFDELADWAMWDSSQPDKSSPERPLCVVSTAVSTGGGAYSYKWSTHTCSDHTVYGWDRFRPYASVILMAL